MNDLILTIFELPKAIKALILALSLAIVVGGYYFLFLGGIEAEIEKLDGTIGGPKGLRATVAQKEGIARHLNDFKEEVEKLDIELTKALKELPDSKEIPQLLSKISDKAKDAGLEIRLFKPQSEQKKEFYSEVPVQLELTGTFHQVATFFDDVGHLERIVNLDQFGMIDPVAVDNKVFLKTAVVATSFRFLDEEERPKEEVEGKGKRRKKGRAAKKKKGKGADDDD